MNIVILKLNKTQTNLFYLFSLSQWSIGVGEESKVYPTQLTGEAFTSHLTLWTNINNISYISGNRQYSVSVDDIEKMLYIFVIESDTADATRINDLASTAASTHHTAARWVRREHENASESHWNWIVTNYICAQLNVWVSSNPYSGFARGINLLNDLCGDLMQQQRTKNLMKKKKNSERTLLSLLDAVAVLAMQPSWYRYQPISIVSLTPTAQWLSVCERVLCIPSRLWACVTYYYYYLRNTRLVCLSTV